MKNILKLFILFLFIGITTATANAKNVSIPSITVSENNQSYNVVLNTNENVKYKKVSENSNTIYFEINNIEAKDNIPVLYNNIKTIESVTIQKVSSNKIRIYVKGDLTANSRLFIQDMGGNPFYIEENKFNGVNGKNIGLLAVGVLIFSMFLSSSDKKEELEVKRATYDNNIMLQNMRQNKIIRINDFLNKGSITNPIQHGGIIESDPDLEMIRKSA